MPVASNMSRLLDKIERRLGTETLGLPDKYNKQSWAKTVICNETLDTFSRFFPRKIPYILGPENKKGPFYLIDENICESFDILGAGDIDWRAWSHDFPGLLFGGGTAAAYDMLSANGMDYETVADVQMGADMASVFSNGIYLEFDPPNMIRLNMVISTKFLLPYSRIPIHLFVKHADNLMTIAPTKMETFEELALGDVATYIFQYLKMYDNLETVYANVDLKLNTLEEASRKRDEIVDRLRQDYVSASNTTQPIMLTVN